MKFHEVWYRQNLWVLLDGKSVYQRPAPFDNLSVKAACEILSVKYKLTDLNLAVNNLDRMNPAQKKETEELKARLDGEWWKPDLTLRSWRRGP